MASRHNLFVQAGTAFMRFLGNAASLIYDTTDDVMKFMHSDGATVRSVVTTDQTQTLTNKTLTSPVITTPTIDGVAQVAADRQRICTVFSIDGAALHAAAGGVLAALQFPAAAIIERVVLDVTTVATAACTLDVGYTPTSAATSSDTLLDGVDVNAAVATFDSMNSLLDTAANALAQKAASGKWITVDEKTGDSTGLVAKLYIFWTKI